jgi:hypothetical protein
MPEIRPVARTGAGDAASHPSRNGAAIRPFLNGVQPLPRPGPCVAVPLDRADWEIPVAKATLNVVAAYRDLQEADPRSLPPDLADSFRALCDSVCTTVVALDELTASAWCQEPA